MASRKTLLEISYHDDDDTGMYQIGEVDFGISGNLDAYIEKYGREGLKEILLTLTHLIWHVTEYGYKIVKRIEPQGEENIKSE